MAVFSNVDGVGIFCIKAYIVVRGYGFRKISFLRFILNYSVKTDAVSCIFKYYIVISGII